MAIHKAEVVGPWGLDSDGANVPQVELSYFYDVNGIRLPNTSMLDVTGQPSVPTDPNLVSVQIACDQVILDEIEADAGFDVLWREEA